MTPSVRPLSGLQASEVVKSNCHFSHFVNRLHSNVIHKPTFGPFLGGFSCGQQAAEEGQQ